MNPPTEPVPVSSWCSPAPGTRHSAREHEKCQARLEDGRLTGCACTEAPRHSPRKDAA